MRTRLACTSSRSTRKPFFSEALAVRRDIVLGGSAELRVEFERQERAVALPGRLAVLERPGSERGGCVVAR